MRITDIGTQAILQSLSTGFIFQINIDTVKLGALNTDLGSPATDVPGGVVYTVPAASVKSSKLNNKTILFEITLNENVGDFTYGSVGLYLTTGELFAYDIFAPYPKKANNLPVQLGDTHKHYYSVTCQDLSSAVTLTFAPIVPSELPSVNTAALLPAAASAPNSLYIVKTHSAFSNKPALAYTNGASWVYSPLDSNTLQSFTQSPTMTGTATATGTNSIAAGNATANGNENVVLGTASATGNNNIVARTGNLVTTHGDHHVIIGDRNSGGSLAGQHHNTLIGGLSNSVLNTVNNATAIGAEYAVLEADYSIAVGKNPKTNTVGESAHAVGMFSRAGDAQHSRILLKAISNSMAPTELFADSIGRFIVEPNSAIFGKGTMLMVCPSPEKIIAWDFTLRAENTVGNSGILRAHSFTVRSEYPVIHGVTFVVNINNPLNALQFIVNPENTSATRWLLDFELTRIMW